MTNRRSAGDKWQASAAVISLLAGVVLAVSAFFNWSGVPYSSTGDRRISFVAAALAIAVSVIMLWSKRSVLGWNTLFGFVAVQMTVVTMKEIEEHSYEYAAYPQAQVQPPLHVAVVSAVVILAVGALSLLMLIGGWVGRRVRKLRT